jgi:phage-related protein
MAFDIASAPMLLEIGDFGLSEQIDFRVLEFSFGDGYEDSALVGSTEGTLSWKLTFKVLPGFLGQEISGPLSAESRAEYLWNFFKDRMAAGNETFKFISPRDGRMYLAAFAETKLSYELFAVKMFSSGISLKQRREPGVVIE